MIFFMITVGVKSPHSGTHEINKETTSSSHPLSLRDTLTKQINKALNA